MSCLWYRYCQSDHGGKVKKNGDWHVILRGATIYGVACK